MTESTETETTHHDDRRLLRQFILAFFGILVLVACGIGLAMLLREGPRDYFAHPPNREQRMALIEQAEAEAREAQVLLATNDTAETRLRRDAALIAAAIHRHALENEGRLPRTLSEAGITPDKIEPGIRYNYGSRHWRLFQENNRLLARGN